MTSFRQHAATALAAGAMAVGALALTAPVAQAQSFAQSCVTNPGAYASGAVKGVYHTERRGNDRDQICKVYDAANKLLGTTTKTDYNYYVKHVEVLPVPPLSAQVQG